MCVALITEKENENYDTCTIVLCSVQMSCNSYTWKKMVKSVKEKKIIIDKLRRKQQRL